MFGALTDAFVKSARSYPLADKFGLNVIKVVERDGKGIVNTTLPCVAICMVNSPSSIQWIGGVIYDRLVVKIQVLLDFVNYSVSEDQGFQSSFEDLAFEVFRHVEVQVTDRNNPFFADLRKCFDFNGTYTNGVKTYTTKAFDKEITKEIKVYEVTYVCNVVDARAAYALTEEILLESAELKLQDTVNLTGEDIGEPQTTIIP